VAISDLFRQTRSLSPKVRMMSGEAFNPRKLLTEALDRYRARRKAGEDLAEAGMELAWWVSRSLGGPAPCAPSRVSILEIIHGSRSLEDLEYIRQEVVGDKPDCELTEAVRESVHAVEERIREIQSPEWQRANPPDPFDSLWADTEFKPVLKSAEDYESLVATIRSLQGRLSETLMDLRERLALTDPNHNVSEIATEPLDIEELEEIELDLDELDELDDGDAG